jgi:hypothetical protein
MDSLNAFPEAGTPLAPFDVFFHALTHVRRLLLLGGVADQVSYLSTSHC